MRNNSQTGFTLMELMTASVATGVVILAATALMLKTLSWYDEISAKFAMNRHARETYDLFAYGGYNGTAGHDGTKNVYSLRGLHSTPSNGFRTNFALQYTNNQITLMPDKISQVAVTCKVNDLPICNQNNVQGWIGSDIQFNGSTRSINNQTTEVLFNITSPYEVQRAQDPAPFSDTYGVIFTRNRNENDP